MKEALPMGIVNKIFSSVNGLYNSLNPITLSGVNDVIVVRGEDGKLRCSPFQLRFSRLYFYNAKAKTVDLFVNGILTDIRMVITSQGDLFFEQERARDAIDYRQVIEYFKSNEENLEAILATRLSLKPRKQIESTIKNFNIPYALDDTGVIRRGPHPLDDEMIVQEKRMKNLDLRFFAKKKRMRPRDEIYGPLVSLYGKFGALLGSPEHYSALLDLQELLLYLFEGLIENRQADGPTLSFSACIGNKIEKSVEETFHAYLTKEIEDPDNTAVCIEAELVCGRRRETGPGAIWTGSLNDLSLSSCNRGRIGARPGVRNVRVFLSYRIFSRIFFELRSSRNRFGKMVSILESEYNKALGWNFFGSKQPIKNDIGFSLELSPEELERLNLKNGKNEVVFKVSGQQRQLEGNIFLWNKEDKIVVSDIDGTITKSDILGHLYSFVGKDWTHNGVAALHTRILKNGYKLLYLTSRSLGQSFTTRTYLRGVSQGSFTLPDGPIIHSPDGLFSAIYREVIIKRPEEFKIHCLTTIKNLFYGVNPFIAGFGNRINDVYTYKALGIPYNRIYTINSSGNLIAEYTQSLVGTYHTLNEFIDSIFPNLNGSKEAGAPGHEYSDFSWWR